MIIKNAKVFTDGCRFVEKDLVIRDGRIVFGAAPQENEEELDAKGSYALPCRPLPISRPAKVCWLSAPPR